MRPQLQSTSLYIVNHHVKICHLRLGQTEKIQNLLFFLAFYVSEKSNWSGGFSCAEVINGAKK